MARSILSIDDSTTRVSASASPSSSATLSITPTRGPYQLMQHSGSEHACINGRLINEKAMEQEDTTIQQPKTTRSLPDFLAPSDQSPL
jgi:hypothetical protein